MRQTPGGCKTRPRLYLSADHLRHGRRPVRCAATGEMPGAGKLRRDLPQGPLAALRPGLGETTGLHHHCGPGFRDRLSTFHLHPGQGLADGVLRVPLPSQ